MSRFFFVTNLIFDYCQYAFAIALILVLLATVFWSLYLVNEILLAQKKLRYSLKYIIDERVGTIIRNCNTDKWKSALLLLIGISESLFILSALLTSGSALNFLNLTESCDTGFSIQTYQLLLYPGLSMLFMTIIFSLLNIITVFFIGIYSYHSIRNNHKKQLVFLCIQTCVLTPLLLVPYTLVYGMFICICLMTILSYKWIRNTQQLLLYLKWRYEDMRIECQMTANRIRVMRRRYRMLIYVLIIALQPVIPCLFCEFVFKCLIVSYSNCTPYYSLQFLDLLSPQLMRIAAPILELIMTVCTVPVAIFLLFNLLYSAWFFAGILWRYVFCCRTRNNNVLYQSLLVNKK